MYTPNLLGILNIEKWQALQDALAATTGMAIITVDYKGVPVTRHSACRQFCQLVRTDEVLSKYCEKCDSRGGLEAIRQNRPYIYQCHFSILDAAIPILVNDRYVGAIMAGQVLLSDEAEALEPICVASSKALLEKHTQQYEEYYAQLPKMTWNEVKTAVDLLFHLCNYVVSDAMEKSLLLSMMGDKQAGLPQQPEEKSPQYSLSTLESLRQTIGSAIISARLPEGGTPDGSTKSDLLRPAMEYLDRHKNQNVPVKKLAELCHISPGYFSKVFQREFGETYSAYTGRRRVAWGKQLLETTQKTVTEIALDIGFGDAAHFVKIFKRVEGVTPARYRTYFAK